MNTLENFEKVLDFIKTENVYAEDIFNQIQWLEKMEFEICHMYEKYGKHFQCQFEERKEKLSEAFFEFTDSLTEDLGMVLESMFLKRNKLRNIQEEEKDKNAKSDEEV